MASAEGSLGDEGEEGIEDDVMRRRSSLSIARPTAANVSSALFSIERFILTGSYDAGKENMRMPARAVAGKAIPSSAAAQRS